LSVENSVTAVGCIGRVVSYFWQIDYLFFHPGKMPAVFSMSAASSESKMFTRNRQIEDQTVFVSSGINIASIPVQRRSGNTKFGEY